MFVFFIIIFRGTQLEFHMLRFVSEDRFLPLLPLSARVPDAMTRAGLAATTASTSISDLATKLITEMEAMCPSKAIIDSPEILTETKLQADVVENPRRAEITPHTQVVFCLRNLVRGVLAKHPAFVDKTLLGKLGDAVMFGKLCVSARLVLMNLKDMEKNPLEAEKSANKVKERIDAKQVVLPKHLLQALVDVPKKFAAAAAHAKAMSGQ